MLNRGDRRSQTPMCRAICVSKALPRGSRGGVKLPTR